ncbi:Dipeptidyl aminopeptidase BI [Vitis vinifera]|uniref:Prolyl endopeptidase n=1 Tax=Vitis vinifera TaxID=29760 RepID=A0A438FP05_VITVI|nr:Dipeptidyl aminopeptidase BI [Vitis vinifera]
MEIGDLSPWFFPLPSGLCKVVPCSNHDFMNFVYRVVVSSPVMPDMIIDYDMRQRVFSIVQQEEVLGVFGNSGSFSQTHDLNTNKLLDAQNGENKHAQITEVQRWKDFSDAYCCERKEVISHDGVEVPLTILYSREAWKKGLSPGLLQGYGAYGEVLDKAWCSDRLSLLDRGWVVAFADVRGGGGPDSSWHKCGSGLNKLNSIYDFVLCGKYLVNEGYVHEDQLGAIGFSAGGLLVGAAINMCPDMFRAAILKVITYETTWHFVFDILIGLKSVYHDFGNLYHLLCMVAKKTAEGRSLFFANQDKVRFGDQGVGGNGCKSGNALWVGVWEAAKWVAKVRDSTCSSCSSGVILKTNMNGGHLVKEAVMVTVRKQRMNMLF